MKYKLGIRQIEESDIGPDCPTMPVQGDFKMYLDAFVEVINSSEIVANTVETGGDVIIELIQNASGEQLQQALIAIHKAFWGRLRTTGLTVISD